jgi:hypothetical protein
VKHPSFSVEKQALDSAFGSPLTSCPSPAPLDSEHLPSVADFKLDAQVVPERSGSIPIDPALTVEEPLTPAAALNVAVPQVSPQAQVAPLLAAAQTGDKGQLPQNKKRKAKAQTQKPTAVQNGTEEKPNKKPRATVTNEHADTEEVQMNKQEPSTADLAAAGYSIGAYDDDDDEEPEPEAENIIFYSQMDEDGKRKWDRELMQCFL